MFEIIKKESLAPNVELLRVAAPLIADKAQPGHFVVVRNNQQGERIPLTIADYDREAGTIDLVIQAIGYSTKELCQLEVGDEILDILGPLGEPIEIEELGTVLCVAGGIGVAPIYPKAKELKAAGNQIITLVGAQSEEMIIMKDRLEAVSDEIYFST
ncbi:MAG: FAD-binding oxidoreductase, partial [Bacillota bacterium]